MINRTIATLLILLCLASAASAQSVCLPAPRLLATMPMGGQVGTEFEVTIRGQTIENLEGLMFLDASNLGEAQDGIRRQAGSEQVYRDD